MFFENLFKKKPSAPKKGKTPKPKSITGKKAEAAHQLDLNRKNANLEERIEELEKELAQCKALLVEKTIKANIELVEESGSTPLPSETMGMAKTLLDLKDELDRLKEQRKAAEYKFGAVNEALKAQMLANNLGKFEYLGKLFHFVEKLYCNIPAGNKPLVLAALRENGHENIIRDDVGTADLKELIKMYREENEGKELPEYLIKDGEPLVKVFAPMEVGIKKATKKKG